MNISKVNEQRIYKGKIFDLYERTIKYPDGKTAKYDVLTHNGAAAIVPIDEEKNFYFVRQYRPAIEEFLLEIPAGLVEVGEDPKNCADRETQEEIGLKPEKVTLLGEFYLAPGYSNEYMYLYLAEGLTESKLIEDHDEYIEEIVSISFDEVKQKLRCNYFKDVKTIVGLQLAINLIENNG